MTTLHFQSQACVAGILLQTRTFIPYPGILVLDIRTFSCTNCYITARNNVHFIPCSCMLHVPFNQKNIFELKTFTFVDGKKPLNLPHCNRYRRLSSNYNVSNIVCYLFRNATSFADCVFN